MSTRRLTRLALLAGLALVLPACEGMFDPDGPVLVPEAALTFVRVADDAPPVEHDSVSFWVKRGEEREVQIRYVYHDAAGHESYSRCLVFRVPAQAPLRYPDGRLFAEGDSVRVTVRLHDKSFYRFEFQPAGLRFDPAHPARLEVRYRYMDPDINGDGVVDQRDQEAITRFAWWRQERPGEGWERIPTDRLPDLLEAHAQITGFTRYALASE